MTRRKAFTLVELLVVIAIMALLVSILVPALGKARAQAKGAVCGTQLKQFGMAWHYYAEDNDGFNIWYAPSNLWASGGFWFYQLGPYLGDSDFARGKGNTREGILEIMNCPATQPWTNKYNDTLGYGAADMAWQWRTVGSDYHEGGYTLNGWMQQQTGGSDSRFYTKYDAAKGDTPLIADGGWVDTWPQSYEAADAPSLIDLEGSGVLDGDGFRLWPSSVSRLILARHGRAINIVFKDTHAEKVLLEKVWSFIWHDGFVPVSELVLPE